MAGIPIQFNSEVQVTDEMGVVTKSMIQTTTYSVSSAVDAISFPMLYSDGETFALQSPITIAATRLLTSPSIPCRVVVAGVPNIFFSTQNQSEVAFSVPLKYTLINSILSVTGEATPPETFAPGMSGFVIPEVHFARADGLAGVWRFLGINVPIVTSPDYCVSEAVPGQCATLSDALVQLPSEYTQAIVKKVISQALKIGQQGAWQSTLGSFRLPFLKRAGQAIALMKPVQASQSRELYICDADVQSSACQTILVPKAQYLKSFENVFSGKWPKGLARIQAQKKKELRNFKAELRKVPDRYVSCPKSR